MQRKDHTLLSASLGSHKTLSSFHFGKPGSGPKIYIQASLHAEELPGMLVAHHLRAVLETLDASAQIQGEIVLVPMANPIGLAQRLAHKPMGRFEFDTAENFNRCYPDLAAAVEPEVRQKLGIDPSANVVAVRQAIGQYLNSWQPKTELQSMRRSLLLLAHDADYVLDLHCDCEAVMHFYTEDRCWPQLAPLAHFLQSQAILLATAGGSHSFDECLSGVWSQLAQRLVKQGIEVPLPQACHSTTIELRGELEVRHDLAKTDAQAILGWLRLIGVLSDQAPPEVPAARCAATPLAGSETLYADRPGLVVFAVEPGQTVQVGELIAEVIDPINQQTQAICAGVSGVLYARIRDRYVHSGCELGKIAGALAFRTGELLGA
jgi:predicted deacylase